MGRPSASFSIAETGVSRSATSVVHTSTACPRAARRSNSSKPAGPASRYLRPGRVREVASVSERVRWVAPSHLTPPSLCDGSPPVPAARGEGKVSGSDDAHRFYCINWSIRSWSILTGNVWRSARSYSSTVSSWSSRRAVRRAASPRRVLRGIGRHDLLHLRHDVAVRARLGDGPARLCVEIFATSAGGTAGSPPVRTAAAGGQRELLRRRHVLRLLPPFTSSAIGRRPSGARARASVCHTSSPVLHVRKWPRRAGATLSTWTRK